MTAIRIHHATAKRATEHGVALRLYPNDHEATGASAEKGKSQVFCSDPKEALAWVLLAETLRTEYPVFAVVSNADTMEVELHYGSQGDCGFDDGVPTLAEIQEYCEENDLDMEAQPEDADEEDETESTGSVVAQKYRVAYAERGNPDHCGDWLAGYLDGQFTSTYTVIEGDETVTKEAFDHEAYSLFLAENGVPLEGKWTLLPTSGQRGWAGRYRMTGRSALEKYIARAGFVVLGGARTDIPAEALTVLRAKHAKWIAKQEKLGTKQQAG